MTYPQGTPSSGVYDVFTDNSFTPDDVVKAIRDNHSPVNKMTMLISLGHQVSLIQNFINARYLGRSALPIEEGFITSGYFDNVLCLSGSFSSDFAYVNMNKYLVDISEYQGGIGGYTYLYPMKIELGQFGALMNSGTVWLNTSGIQASGAGELVFANPSNEYDPSYNGIVRLYGKEIILQSSGIINLSGNSTTTKLNFYGDLLISGQSATADIVVSNRLLPSKLVDTVTGTEQDLGSDTPNYKAFLNGYIQTIHTQAHYATGHGLGSGTKVFAGTFGGVCGASIDDSDYGLKVSSSYTCGSYQYLNAGVGPNKIYLRRNQNGQDPISGYLQLNSGQLEFYKIGGSGWVLTGF